MAGAATMTVRIDPDLLAALKVRAAREGRSVSAEIIRLVRREVGAQATKRPRRATTMGMFADFESPSLDEFKRMRNQLSSSLKAPKERRRAP